METLTTYLSAADNSRVVFQYLSPADNHFQMAWSATDSGEFSTIISADRKIVNFGLLTPSEFVAIKEAFDYDGLFALFHDIKEGGCKFIKDINEVIKQG